MIGMGSTGTYTDNYGNEKKIDPSLRGPIALNALAYFLYSLGVLPSEAGSIIKYNVKSYKKEQQKDEKRELQGYKNKSEMKRYDRELWEMTYGEKSPGYKEREAEREAKKLERKLLQQERDKEYNYTPEEKKKKKTKRKKKNNRFGGKNRFN